MARRLNILNLALLLLAMVSPAKADVLILVHGYAADARSWEFSGINRLLHQHGWINAGVIPPALPDTALPASKALNKNYRVNLPAEAPLQIQANILNSGLQSLRNTYPAETLILAGHSAGGVISRLAILNGNPAMVKRLITIASPHLGTHRAAQGLNAIDSKPFFCPGPGISFLKSFFGGNQYNYLENSRGVLIDLLPEKSGNILYWANQQTHPDIDYFSIIRKTPYRTGDRIVPAFSQDMNNIPALRGKSKTLLANSGHGLTPQDGQLLLSILNNK